MSSLWRSSSKVRYSRLPTSDAGGDWNQQNNEKDYESLDFSSAFSYKSAFTYSKVAPPYVQEERSEYMVQYNREIILFVVFVLICFYFCFVFAS